MKVHVLALLVCIYLADYAKPTASSSDNNPIPPRRNRKLFSLLPSNQSQKPVAHDEKLEKLYSELVQKPEGDYRWQGYRPLMYRGVFENYAEDNNHVKRIAATGGYKAEDEEVRPNSLGKKMLQIKNRGLEGVDVKLKTRRDGIIENHFDAKARYVILERDDGDEIRIKIVDERGNEFVHMW